MSCPFSPPKLHDDRQEITWQNDLYLLIQQEHPVLINSGCIIPKDHREMPFDLTRKEWNSSHDLLHAVKTLLDERHSPDGYTIGWNCGATGGQTVFHMHLHVIPRFADELYTGQGIRNWLRRDENRRPNTQDQTQP
jgi:diadenosine tetraphosphate (Ap4A) HIT family hydrolase